MKIGFTGTRAGLNKSQLEHFSEYIKKLKPTEFHHGDCIGADSEAHGLICNYNIYSNFRTIKESCKIIIHPPIEDASRAFCEVNETKNSFCLKPKDYLERNRDIVNAIELLIACPRDVIEQIRSGTWATIRYAKKRGKKVIIIYPDGRVEKDEPK